MTITFKIRIRDLLTEFPADALIVFCLLKSAGTVAVFCFQSLPDGSDNFRVGIEADNSHNGDLLLCQTPDGARPACRGMMPIRQYYTTISRNENLSPDFHEVFMRPPHRSDILRTYERRLLIYITVPRGFRPRCPRARDRLFYPQTPEPVREVPGGVVNSTAAASM